MEVLYGGAVVFNGYIQGAGFRTTLSLTARHCSNRPHQSAGIVRETETLQRYHTACHENPSLASVDIMLYASSSHFARVSKGGRAGHERHRPESDSHVAVRFALE